jgi:U3 small nucleolar RNA-associated protein 3
MKFEQAKKKVASQRAVFKPGQDAGAYAGERSGISRVVKSTRL